MKDDTLIALTDAMVALKAEKPKGERTIGHIHRDMLQNVALTNKHLRENYSGNKEAKMWIKENEKFVEELMSRG